jgi:NADPH:quinone reductase-like Zn-dependent oxidoreductase
MKAAVYHKYGPPDVVAIEEVETPTPGDNDVLVKVRATTVTTGDARMRAFRMPRGFGLPGRLGLGILAPRNTVLGMDFAGDVAAVGRNVTTFKVGDAVFGAAGRCHAEFVVVRHTASIALKPAVISYDEAAAAPFGGVTALVFLNDWAGVRPGDSVLVIGASGAVGSAAVQIARDAGAEVTGVCSAANADLVRSLGARATIDYAREDFTQNGATYDIIMDTVRATSFARAQGALKAGGRYLALVTSLSELLFLPAWTKMTGTKRAIAGVAVANGEKIRALAQLLETGRFKPVIGARYPLERIAEAHAAVDSGHKRGNLVVTLGV